MQGSIWAGQPSGNGPAMPTGNSNVHPAFHEALSSIAGYTDAELLAADRARNVNKAERLGDANAAHALKLQQRYGDAIEAAGGVVA